MVLLLCIDDLYYMLYCILYVHSSNFKDPSYNYAAQQTYNIQRNFEIKKFKFVRYEVEALIKICTGKLRDKWRLNGDSLL
jgi:hypothetical protein